MILMRMIHRFAICFALCFAFAAATVATAQQPASPVTITPSADSAAAHNWTTEQILTCTVSDCWQLAGKNETTFFDIIQQLAEISAQTRGLTLPDNAEAGKRTGEYIKAKARTDHGQLLYAIVDAAVRKVGTKAATN
jgi:invasion protein IalB